MKKIFIIILILSASLLGQMQNKKYSIKKTILGSANKIDDFNNVEFIVKNDDGTELYRIMDRVDYDIPYSKLEVFNDGSSVLISAFNGKLTFINAGGSMRISKKITSDISPMYERSIQSVVFEKSIVILLPDEKAKKSLIQTYNSDGELLNEFVVPFCNTNGISYSGKMNKVFISYNEWNNSGEVNKKIAIYNSRGKREKTFKGEFEKGFFTKDNEFIGYSNKQLISINANSLTLNFKKDVPENKIYIGLSFYNNIIVISANSPFLENGKWIYSNPTLTNIDLSGNVIKSSNYPIERFSKVDFVFNNNILELKLDNEIVDIKF